LGILEIQNNMKNKDIIVEPNKNYLSVMKFAFYWM